LRAATRRGSRRILSPLERASFSDDLHQNAFSPLSVEFSVKDLSHSPKPKHPQITATTT
jgi:hypothetical protein